jgi:hypothetical protein
MWNLAFPAAGDYTIRILVDGSERKRLPLLVEQRDATGASATPRHLPHRRPVRPEWSPADRCSPSSTRSSSRSWSGSTACSATWG